MERKDVDIVKKMQYILNMRSVLNKNAFFSDGTEYYRTPAEPREGDEVTIRFRTQRNNVDAVYLVCDGKHIEMEVTETAKGFDYYSARITMGSKVSRYHFEIIYGSLTCYYNTQGVRMEYEERMDFEIYPGYETPDWAKGAVMYQIYIDRFYNGDKSNDVETGEYFYIGDVSTKVDNWEKTPAVMGVREFYGGDLQGILDKLDYLQDLGVEVLYLNPAFVSPSNHKYDCQDYDYIDPHYGKIVEDCDGLLNPGDRENAHAYKYIRRVTDKRNLEASNELFAKLVEEVHKRGMRVILDGVFNHCGSFNKWMDRERIYENQEGYPKGAYVSADSPYRDFFDFKDTNRWPYNPTYDGWWTHDTLPKLNYEASTTLYDYILKVGKKWVSPPYNVDGWRLDVAADLGHSNEFNHQFWKDFRRAVKEANPEAIILAEHYGNPEGWLLGDEWDTVMNYDAFMEPITWFLTGMEKHSDEARPDSYGNPDYFFGAMHHNMARMGGQSVAISMNELSNHDHSRFLTRTNRTVGRTNTLGPEAANNNVNKAVFKEAVVMQMTLPGAPTVYYGDEAGVCGFTDPDNRRTYPWGHEDTELIDFHRVAIKMHKENDVLRKGSYKSLYSAYNVVAYGRFTSDDAAIIIVNNNDDEVRARIPAWEVGLGFDDDVEQLLVTFEGGYSTDGLGYHLQNGWLDIGLRKTSAVVLHKMKW